jgi:hypothetical protein
LPRFLLSTSWTLVVRVRKGRRREAIRQFDRVEMSLYSKKTNRAKRSPGEGEAERRKLPDRTQRVNPARERLATPRKRVLRRRQ